MGKRTDENCDALEFSQGTLKKIHDRLRVALSQPFIDELNQILNHFRPIILSVPTHSNLGPEHLDVSKQAQWVQNSIITAAERLRDALQNDGHKLHSAMSSDMNEMIDTATYIPMLNALINDADKIFVELDQQAALGIRNSEQIKFEITNAIWSAFSTHFGDQFSARGQRNADQSVQLAFAEIYGQNESLASLLKLMRISS